MPKMNGNIRVGGRGTEGEEWREEEMKGRKGEE